MDLLSTLSAGPFETQTLSGTATLSLRLRLVSPQARGRLALTIEAVEPRRPPTRTVVVATDFAVLPPASAPSSDWFNLTLGPVVLPHLRIRRGTRFEVVLRGAGVILDTADMDQFVEFAATLELTSEVGRCIYCGAVDGALTTEHIVPRGLRGRWALQRASCSDCQVMTRDFETRVMRADMLPARQAFGLASPAAPTPALRDVVVERDGVRSATQSPAADVPVFLKMPVFLPPGMLSGSRVGGGLVLRAVWLRHVAGPDPRAWYRAHVGSYVGTQSEMPVVSFARMVAKIALGMAVRQLGVGGIREHLVVHAIRGDLNALRNLVGCVDADPISPATGLHSCTLDATSERILVRVRLFAQFGAPEYTVLVGR